MDDQREGLPLLLTDMRVALLLLSESRYRLLHRAFGVSRDQANIVTLLLLAVVGAEVHQRVEAMSQPPSRDEMANMWLGGAVVRELVSQLAGPAARNTPFGGDLLMLAVLVCGGRPMLRALGRWHPGRRIFVSFRHRYGHLLPSRRSRPGGTGAPPSMSAVPPSVATAPLRP